VSRGRRAQFRPCRLEPRPLEAAVEWIDRSRRVWTERLDQLDEHLRAIQAPTKPTTKPTTKPAAKSATTRKKARHE
jgi:hypothetical protein